MTTITTTTGSRVTIEAEPKEAKKIFKQIFPTIKIKEDENIPNRIRF